WRSLAFSCSWVPGWGSGGEDGELLVGATDDGLRIETHPLAQHGAVDRAEVDGVAEVLAVEPLRGLERGVLGVETTLDVVADQEGAAAGAVVGPAAVVFDPPAELGEDHDAYVVGGVVVAE